MNKSAKKLIIFFIPPKKVIDGGLMSIFSLCKESRSLYPIHQSDVLISIYPCSPSYKKNDLFANDEKIYSFHEVIKKYPKLQSLIIHFPNAAAKEIYNGLIKHEKYISNISNLQINVLNQNIEHMPEIEAIASLFSLTSKLTQSTAHDSYATQEICDRYGIPLYHLSVFIDSKQYAKRTYTEKLNTIVYSPDEHPMKDKIINKLKSSFPNFDFTEIKGMTYSVYKKTISKAKFMITFGEGFDGYFIESSFSGGIPFAVYDEDFFPSKDFQKYRNIYKDYSDMLRNICEDIEKFDEEEMYKNINLALSKKLKDFYNFKKYIGNIRNFYLGKFTYLPTQKSQLKFLLEAIKQKDGINKQREDLIAKYEDTIREYFKDLNEERQINYQKDRIIESIYNSFSWKITKPVRQLSKKFKKSRKISRL